MSKGKPKNVPASVRARLAEVARTRGDEFQLVLTRYAIERFLYRLSVSPTRTGSSSRGRCSSSSGRPSRTGRPET